MGRKVYIRRHGHKAADLTAAMPSQQRGGIGDCLGLSGPIICYCPDSEVRIILRSHVSNFGIERTLVNLLIQCGLGSEVRRTNSRRTLCGLPTATLGTNQEKAPGESPMARLKFGAFLAPH